MARKSPATLSRTASSPKAKSVEATTSPVRKTMIPRPTFPAPIGRELTHAAVAERAYALWQDGVGGSDLDHWYRAEDELLSA